MLPPSAWRKPNERLWKRWTEDRSTDRWNPAAARSTNSDQEPSSDKMQAGPGDTHTNDSSRKNWRSSDTKTKWWETHSTSEIQKPNFPQQSNQDYNQTMKVPTLLLSLDYWKHKVYGSLSNLKMRNKIRRSGKDPYPSIPLGSYL
jgi:hypothetical protein